jgi:hypothetical protein
MAPAPRQSPCTRHQWPPVSVMMENANKVCPFNLATAACCSPQPLLGPLLQVENPTTQHWGQHLKVDLKSRHGAKLATTLKTGRQMGMHITMMRRTVPGGSAACLHPSDAASSVKYPKLAPTSSASRRSPLGPMQPCFRMRCLRGKETGA